VVAAQEAQAAQLAEAPEPTLVLLPLQAAASSAAVSSPSATREDPRRQRVTGTLADAGCCLVQLLGLPPELLLRQEPVRQ
jgi:hypothetical protein